MKQTVTFEMFKEAFKAQRPNQFSLEALRDIFDWIESMEFCGNEIEFDVIAICCDFEEADAIEVAERYDITTEHEHEIFNAVYEYLDDSAQLIGVTSENKFVYTK